MLEIGTTAPDIALEDTAGRPVRLADHLGEHGVLVYFMRSTSCPVCNGHVKDLAKRSVEFATNGVRVLVAVPEGRQDAAAWQSRNGLPFPVVTGREGSPHAAVGLMKKVFGAMQESGSILVDSHGIVRHAHSATLPTSSYDKKGIARAIEELRGRDAADGN
ncbi:peroxiredoxin family protein [Streptomyces sp. ISID311]|uniref:peroxiredoxin family protein n=1 Tax=Streptomyces sp. ISID311 TaxID=2601673 RepID=UPI0011BD409E|nr:peroxiredoxin family protein [Streptomyces sp. ISID311]TXC96849.1 peroxiredoxin family protein [Streptomyces sp. ISID311]